MSSDGVSDIPSIVPSRDEVVSRRTRNGKADGGAPSSGSSSGRSSLMMRLVVAISLIIGASALAWNYELQKKLQQAAVMRADFESRIGDLEDRLSDTDESVSQSSVAMQVKIKELYSEVDKLWAQRNLQKQQLAGHDISISANKGLVEKQAGTIKSIRSDTKTQGIQVAALVSQMEEFNEMVVPLKQLLSSSPSDRAQLEALADQLRKLDLDFDAMQQRVDITEEDIEAINGFRRQVWANLSEIQKVLAAQQGNLPANP